MEHRDGVSTGHEQARAQDPPSPLQGVLIEQMPFGVYAQAGGINGTGLKQILRSPAHFVSYREQPLRKETPAQRMGTLTHAALLEPERFAASMVLRPKLGRSNADKQALEAWHSCLPDSALVVTEAEREVLLGILEAAHRHTRLRNLLAEGRREVSLFWQDPDHDVACKARFDFVAARSNIVVDIKTTQDARPDRFARDLVTYQYGLQAAHYLAGAEATGCANAQRFVIVALEKEPPYGIRLYELAPEEIERSQIWRHHAMLSYRRCLQTGEWPGYSEDFTVLQAPAWAPQAIPVETQRSAIAT